MVSSKHIILAGLPLIESKMFLRRLATAAQNAINPPPPPPPPREVGYLESFSNAAGEYMPAMPDVSSYWSSAGAGESQSKKQCSLVAASNPNNGAELRRRNTGSTGDGQQDGDQGGDGEYTIVISPRHLLQRIQTGIRNTLTEENFRRAWNHPYRPNVLMGLGGYYALSWIGYALGTGMFGVWTAAGSLPAPVLLGGALAGGVVGSHLYMKNMEWIEEQIEKFKEHMPMARTVLEIAGVWQICVWIWTAMLMTLFYGTVGVLGFAGYKYLTASPEQRAQIEQRRQEVDVALQDPASLSGRVQGLTSTFTTFMWNNINRSPAAQDTGDE